MQNPINIYVYYYIRDSEVILELRRVIRDKMLIKHIISELIQKGEYSNVVIVVRSPISKIKLLSLLKKL